MSQHMSTSCLRSSSARWHATHRLTTDCHRVAQVLFADMVWGHLALYSFLVGSLEDRIWQDDGPVMVWKHAEFHTGGWVNIVVTEGEHPKMTSIALCVTESAVLVAPTLTWTVLVLQQKRKKNASLPLKPDEQARLFKQLPFTFLIRHRSLEV